MFIWDLGGQDFLRSIWKKYFSESNAIYFAIDTLDTERFDEAIKVLKELINSSELSHIPFIIFLNKSVFPLHFMFLRKTNTKTISKQLKTG